MAYLPGGNLARRREEFAGDPRKAVALLIKVARGVQAAHDSGVVHRDLKPGNILLDEHGEPLISDFGLAKLADADTELTGTGQVPGTPPYMAPEQTEGSAGPAVDVWALGVIAYELLTGRRPFTRPHAEALLREIRRAAPTPPRRLRPELDAALEAVVLHCLQKDPARRPASASALADELEHWLEHRPMPTVRQPDRRRRRILTLAALGGLALLITLLAVPSLGSRPRSIAERLAAGEDVVLVGAEGVPPGSKWILGEGGREVSHDDGSFRINGGTLALLLLAAEPGPAYLLTAEVRCHAAGRGRVGVFFAHSEEPASEARSYHKYLDVGYHEGEVRKAADGSPEGACTVRVQFRGNQTHGPHPTLQTAHFRPRVAEPANDPTRWRKLSVRVAPQEFQVTWLGRPLAPWDWPRLADWFQPHLRVFAGVDNFPNADPTIRPDGGVGLFIDDNVASFRNVVLHPP
jgi:serine/threonine-protein kinase